MRSPTRFWSPGGVSTRCPSRGSHGCWASRGGCSPTSAARLRRRRSLSQRLALASPASVAWEPPAGIGPELADALSGLTEHEREALLLIAWDGLTPGEAAVVADCTPAAFRVRLHRARRRVAARLGIDETDDETNDETNDSRATERLK